jgi:hypothetical protein
MMVAGASLEPLLTAGAVALVVIGATGAIVAPNIIKRSAGLLISGFGALAGLAALGAPSGAMLAGVAVLFAQTALGAAIAVRLQEGYGSVEAPEVDAADGEDDARGQAS